ncbi:MAG: DNA-protecting protein DprA [Acidimicrobiales bacterium]|nr:DNA-protecting protein DprA [Acidimicrobiales bacterium]
MSHSVPDEAFALAIATLPEVGPARRLVLHRAGDLRTVWSRICDGSIGCDPQVRRALGLGIGEPMLTEEYSPIIQSWQDHAASLDPAAELDRHLTAGVGVAALGSARYPGAFVEDPEPPTVVCWLGDIDDLVGPRVAIIGTRRCTQAGRDTAFELGYALSAAGVSVVSGLALGIDAAAHRGALAAGGAPPIAVVGSGLDVIYPPANRALWSQVAEAGVVLTELPLGEPPRAWHFPNRNRMIAALADVVVVVESRRRGGSLSTVAAAIRRDRDVMAVPGPVRSPAAEGSNALLRDFGVCCDATDVLLRLGMSPAARRPSAEQRPLPEGNAALILDALGWQPSTLEDLVARVHLPLEVVTLALIQLEEAGWVSEHGGWFERRAKTEFAG